MLIAETVGCATKPNYHNTQRERRSYGHPHLFLERSMNCKIYVATHKPDNHLLQLPNEIYVPIHCGKAIYTPSSDAEEYLPELGDDTGDNISARNKNYCELTATYWIWKNDRSDPNDIVGLNHYRRYFAEPGSNGMQFLTKETIESMIRDAEFIVNGCGTDRDDTKSDEESAYNCYKENNVIVDLDLALEATEKLFPNICQTVIHEVKHSGALSLCNMMICKKKYFDEYCEFLFPVLNYVDDRIDYSDNAHQGYFARALGFLGERLFRPWLKATGYRGVQGPGLDWETYSGYIWE